MVDRLTKSMQTSRRICWFACFLFLLGILFQKIEKMKKELPGKIAVMPDYDRGFPIEMLVLPK